MANDDSERIRFRVTSDGVIHPFAGNQPSPEADFYKCDLCGKPLRVEKTEFPGQRAR